MAPCFQNHNVSDLCRFELDPRTENGLEDDFPFPGVYSQVPG